MERKRNFFQKLLFKKNKEELSTDDAISRLQDTIEQLNKKTKRLEEQIDLEHQQARDHCKTNKRLSLRHLKKKKKYDNQLRKVDNMMETLDTQLGILINSKMNAEVIKTMKLGEQVVKKHNDDMNVDKVNELMDDIADQREIADEITNAISTPVGFDQIDEDELEEELEQEILNSELLHFPAAPTTALPSMPKTTSVVEDENDLEKLRVWAAA